MRRHMWCLKDVASDMHLMSPLNKKLVYTSAWNISRDHVEVKSQNHLTETYSIWCSEKCFRLVYLINNHFWGEEMSHYTVCSESCCALRLWYVDLVACIEVAVVSLYSVVKQWLKCNTSKVCNLIQFFSLSRVFNWGTPFMKPQRLSVRSVLRLIGSLDTPVYWMNNFWTCSVNSQAVLVGSSLLSSGKVHWKLL
jgi:hypothetical protein